MCSLVATYRLYVMLKAANTLYRGRTRKCSVCLLDVSATPVLLPRSISHKTLRWYRVASLVRYEIQNIVLNHVYIYICVCVCVCVCVTWHIFGGLLAKPANESPRARVCVCVYIYVCVCVCVYVLLCTYIHTHARTYIHTCTVAQQYIFVNA